jgi:hypothetical protein
MTSLANLTTGLNKYLPNVQTPNISTPISSNNGQNLSAMAGQFTEVAGTPQANNVMNVPAGNNATGATNAVNSGMNKFNSAVSQAQGVLNQGQGIIGGLAGLFKGDHDTSLEYTGTVIGDKLKWCVKNNGQTIKEAYITNGNGYNNYMLAEKNRPSKYITLQSGFDTKGMEVHNGNRYDYMAWCDNNKNAVLLARKNMPVNGNVVNNISKYMQGLGYHMMPYGGTLASGGFASSSLQNPNSFDSYTYPKVEERLSLANIIKHDCYGCDSSSSSSSCSSSCSSSSSSSSCCSGKKKNRRKYRKERNAVVQNGTETVEIKETEYVKKDKKDKKHKKDVKEYKVEEKVVVV